MAYALNQKLPDGYYAEPQCRFVVEIDAATLAEGAEGAKGYPEWNSAAPARPIATAAATDTVEVQVFHPGGGELTLAGCIALVSPSNKDRPAEREAFVSRCATYLHQSAGLLVVDVVTDRLANLHAALVARLAPDAEGVSDAHIYAAAYRPEPRKREAPVSVWQEALRLGEPLPTMPLWLKGGACLAVELDETYDRTCRALRVLKNGATA
jgi:hypothetical protein